MQEKAVERKQRKQLERQSALQAAKEAKLMRGKLDIVFLYLYNTFYKGRNTYGVVKFTPAFLSNFAA